MIRVIHFTEVVGNFKKAFIFMLFFVLICSCSKSPQEKYEDLSLKIKKEGSSDYTGLTTLFLEAFSSARLNGNDHFINENIAIEAAGEDINVVYPAVYSFSSDEIKIDGISYGDTNSAYLLLGNKKGFNVFNKAGKLIAVQLFEKSTVDSAILYYDEVYFLKDNVLNKFDIKAERVSRVNGTKFLPPYKKFFHNRIIISNNKLGVITGVAGSYYLSVVDLESGNIMIKDILVSSASFMIKENKVYCIKGNSGDWNVAVYHVRTKNKKNTLKIKSIENIYFCENLILLKNGDKYRFYDYDGKEIHSKLKLNISKIMRHGLVVRGKNKLFIVKDKIYLEKTNML